MPIYFASTWPLNDDGKAHHLIVAVWLCVASQPFPQRSFKHKLKWSFKDVFVRGAAAVICCRLLMWVAAAAGPDLGCRPLLLSA